jgi:pimeloyl-ACP methyl ester carboxylesterase
MFTRRSFLKASGAATLSLITGCGVPLTTGSAAPRRTFILVHGAWHGGWCWYRVADILIAHGYRVYAPSLTGVGDRTHLFSKDISLQTHVDDIVSLVEAEELEDFILVGHSYGGFVISGVGDILRERVAHYVYLDAGVPADMAPGASFRWSDFDALGVRKTRLKLIREQGNSVALPPPPAATFDISDPLDVNWVQRQLRPMPLQTYIGRITFRNNGSNGMKRTYIAAHKPLVAACERIRGDTTWSFIMKQLYIAAHRPLVAACERIRGDTTWSFMRIKAGHDSMVTAPDALASLLMSL